MGTPQFPARRRYRVKDLNPKKTSPRTHAAGLVASPPPKEAATKLDFLIFHNQVFHDLVLNRLVLQILRLAERTLSRAPQVSHGTH
jgi:hypothetical protein